MTIEREEDEGMRGGNREIKSSEPPGRLIMPEGECSKLGLKGTQS